MVEGELADCGAHGCLGELRDGVGGVFDAVAFFWGGGLSVFFFFFLRGGGGRVIW